MPRAKCPYGIDTCDGVDGDSLFICRDCVDALWFDLNFAKEKATAHTCQQSLIPPIEQCDGCLAEKCVSDIEGKLRKLGELSNQQAFENVRHAETT